MGAAGLCWGAQCPGARRRESQGLSICSLQSPCQILSPGLPAWPSVPPSAQPCAWGRGRYPTLCPLPSPPCLGRMLTAGKGLDAPFIGTGKASLLPMGTWR